MQRKQWVAVIASGLRDPEKQVRIAAAAILSRLGDNGREAVPALTEALKDNDPDVALAVAHVLVEVDPSKAATAVPVLVEASKNARRGYPSLGCVRPGTDWPRGEDCAGAIGDFGQKRCQRGSSPTRGRRSRENSWQAIGLFFRSQCANAHSC